MLNLILRRIGIAIPVLLTVVTLTFLMVHSAPGGPFDEEKAVTSKYFLPVVGVVLGHKNLEFESML